MLGVPKVGVKRFLFRIFSIFSCFYFFCPFSKCLYDAKLISCEFNSYFNLILIVIFVFRKQVLQVKQFIFILNIVKHRNISENKCVHLLKKTICPCSCSCTWSRPPLAWIPPPPASLGTGKPLRPSTSQDPPKASTHGPPSTGVLERVSERFVYWTV